MREQEFTLKKAKDSIFQKEDLLADESELTPKLLEYTKFFTRRTFTPGVTKKSISRREIMRLVVELSDIHLLTYSISDIIVMKSGENSLFLGEAWI